MRNGLRSSAYAIALSSGKPCENQEQRQSQSGHSSMGEFRMVSLLKMMNSNSGVPGSPSAAAVVSS